MNPYEILPETSFWKLAVGSVAPEQITGLWTPKFPMVQSDSFVTYGSCFAQHIGRALKARAFNWVNVEPAPQGMSDESQKKFNYGVFSSRTANIYTSTLLLQWTKWACGIDDVPDEVWHDNGRFFDPFRPAIEPGGFASIAEMRASQRIAIASFRKGIAAADYFVFTMGLTESWFNAEHGHEYPMCPGTVAGDFSPERHAFVNQSFGQVLAAMTETIALMRGINPKIRFLLTVSPVPLTATKSGKHVLTATTYSKSVLRAVAGQLADQVDCVDYFPSYEIITAPVFGGRFYEPNRRSVTRQGVAFVMDSFFNCLARTPEPPRKETGQVAEMTAAERDQATRDALNCEEAILDAFAPGRG
jgi:GSCFA family